jgi:hypothetical protein
MAKLPGTFEDALKSGYSLEEGTKKTKGGKRTGTLRLRNGSRPELVVDYEADRTGYRFSKPRKAA